MSGIRFTHDSFWQHGTARYFNPLKASNIFHAHWHIFDSRRFEPGLIKVH